MTDAVETMAYVRLEPWHGLGTKVDHAMTASEALQLAGIDWMVRSFPCYFEEEDGLFSQVPNAVANVRETDKKVLGVVTDRYKICQNVEAFDFLDHVIGKEGGAHYETAGALFGGKQVWLLAKMDGVSVLGDQIDPYIVFKNSHDGSTGIQVAITPVRVVCNNTLTMAIEGAKRLWSTTHTGNLDGKLEEARETLRKIKDYMEKYPEVAKAMYSQNLYKDEVPKILEKLFPMPEPINGEPPVKIAIAHVEKARQDVFNIYQGTPDIAKFNGTAWGLYNAISDWSMHVKPLGDLENLRETEKLTRSSRENMFNTTINGHPLLAQAQKILMAVAQ